MQHDRLFDHVPVVDKDEHGDRDERALAQGNVYPAQYLKLARAVKS